MPFRAVLAALLVVAAVGCAPHAPSSPARAAPASSLAPTPSATSVANAPSTTPPAKPGVCADDIPAAQSSDPERDTQLAKTCDAAARCELTCLRARCAYGYECTQACREIKARARRRGDDQVEALNAATTGFEEHDPNVCIELRKRWLEDATPPRSLAKLFQAQAAPVKWNNCQLDEPRTTITEISIERTGCFGSCPIYSLSLHANGSVEYFGAAYVEHLGRRLGQLDLQTFDRLARVVEDLGYFSLQNSYSCSVTDNPTVYLSVLRAGTRKAILHYAPGMTGPPRLRVLEDVIDDYADYVDWSD